MQEDTQYEWLDDILHAFALAESLNETNLSEKLKRKVITADEFDDRLVESYRENKKQAKQAILSHIGEVEAAKTSKVDRLEVIDETGRAYVKGSIYGSPVKVELSYQDEDRTLKVFVAALQPTNSKQGGLVKDSDN